MRVSVCMSVRACVLVCVLVWVGVGVWVHILCSPALQERQPAPWGGTPTRSPMAIAHVSKTRRMRNVTTIFHQLFKHYLLATTLHSIVPCVTLKVAPSPSTSSHPLSLPHLHPCMSKETCSRRSQWGPILHTMSEQRKLHLLFP